MSVDRPQYGEYATPEEQRARAGLPPLESEAAQAEALSAPVAPAPAPRKPPHPFGRIVTAALLGVGLVNVLASIGGFLDLSTTLTTTMRALGIEGEFTNYAAARTWGLIAAIVMVLGYAVTMWLSLRLMRAGRSSWWVPLAGFVVTMMIVSGCVSVPMFGDPAFTQGLLTPPQ